MPSLLSVNIGLLDKPGVGDGAAGNAGLAAVSPPPARPGFRQMAATAAARSAPT